MTTQPGILPRGTDKLNFKKLPVGIQDLIKQIAVRMKALHLKIKTEEQSLIVMDKTELNRLNAGAELTTSSDDDDYDEDELRERRR